MSNSEQPTSDSRPPGQKVRAIPFSFAFITFTTLVGGFSQREAISDRPRSNPSTLPPGNTATVPARGVVWVAYENPRAIPDHRLHQSTPESGNPNHQRGDGRGGERGIVPAAREGSKITSWARISFRQCVT